jgi:hypothetical protein
MSSISSAVIKAIKSSQLGIIRFDKVPDELLCGERLDLRRWTMVLKDENLEFIGSFSRSQPQYSSIDSSSGTLDDMFVPFWEKRRLTGILSLNFTGAMEITDYGLACVARNCPLLSDLKISGCTSIGDAGVREIGLSCRRLTVFHMSGCHNVEGGGLISVSECCHLLSHLDISRCRKLQRWGVHKLFSGCTKLEEVNVSHLSCISDEELRILSQNNRHLISLIGVDAYNISDTGILALSQHCPDLDHLDLSRKQMSNRVTDVSLLALGERSVGLKSLKLSGCDYITDVGINWLTTGCHAIEVLDLDGCNKVELLSPVTPFHLPSVFDILLDYRRRSSCDWFFLPFLELPKYFPSQVSLRCWHCKHCQRLPTLEGISLLRDLSPR